MTGNTSGPTVQSHSDRLTDLEVDLTENERAALHFFTDCVEKLTELRKKESEKKH